MAAPPQLDFEPVVRSPANALDTVPAPPQSDRDLAPPDPYAPLRALQHSRGNYYVQRTIDRYNAAHPLPKQKPAPPKPAEGYGKPAAVEHPESVARSAIPPNAATPRKAAAAPVKPAPPKAPHPKQTAALGKPAPMSGSTAVSAALSTAPPMPKPAVKPMPSAGGGKSGGPTLAQWKAKVKSTAGKNLAAPGPKAAPTAAGALDAQTKKKADAPKPDFGTQAATAIPAPPKVEAPSAPADTLAKSIHDQIAGVSDKHLTDQTLPPLQMSPGHAGIKNPDGQFPVIGDPPVATQDQPPPQDANAAAPPAANVDTAQAEAQKKAAEQKLAEAEAKKKAMEMFLGPTPPPSAVLQDKGPQPRPTIPASSKGDIGESVAIVLSKSPVEAQEMVDLAEKTAYPQAALKKVAPEIAKDAAAPEKTRLDTELHSVAAEAGIEAAEVDAKAHERLEEEKQQCFEADDDLQSKATAAGSAATKKAAEDQKAIAAAKARNDDEIERKSEAAGTPPDPKLVNERQERLLNALDDQSAASRVAYRKALETRNKDIDKAAGDQIVAYQKTAENEAKEIEDLIKAKNPDNPDNANMAKAEAWPSRSWADREAKAVRNAVAILKRDAGKESKGFQDAVTTEQLKAGLRIHDWADERLSRTRSFWEKLIALFTHWEHAAKADTDAWEKARDQDTVDTMAGDLATIANIKDIAARQNIEEMKAAINGLDEEHQILMLQFFKAGGDSILVVATALLGRIEQRRVPELAEEFRQKSLDIDAFVKLNDLAKSQDPGFDAKDEAAKVRKSVKGWGTDEDMLFGALKHRTPLQIKAMKLAYADAYHDDGEPRDMEADIHDDLSGDEDDRATAALKSDDAGQDTFALHQAFTGFWGTDKAAVMETLRNKSPVEVDELLARYKDEYGIDLRDQLLYALPDETDRGRANALLAGDTDKADALGIQAALHSHIFGGAEITEVDAVYAQIRKEVETDAAKKNMNTAEVEAEYKRRAAAVEQQWNSNYADGKQEGMKDAFKDRLSGGEQDLAVALAEDNHIAEDAARIRMESESILYTSDKKVLSVLTKQRERAETEVRRDMTVRFREMAAKEKWTPEEAKKKFEEMNAQAEKDIDAKAQANLDNLEKHYEKYSRGWGPGELTTVIELEMSGNEQEEARLIRKQHGKLTPAQQVYWAIKGLGTDDPLLKHAVQGKTAQELADMRKEYKELAGKDADMDADVLDDVSGRDQFDYFGFGDKLQAAPATPAEEQQRNHDKRDYELGSNSGLGSLFTDEETDTLRRTSDRTDAAYNAYQEAVKAHGEKSEEAQAALDRFRQWSGYTDQSVTELRAAVDTLTDHVAMAAAIIVGAAVAIGTAGSATPAVIAAISALAATSASITVKLAMKGHAYGIEEYGQDVLMGGVDVAVAALTAGVGNALLRTNLLSRLAEDQLVTRVAKYGIAHAGAGLVAGLPTSILGQVISADTWASDAPLKTALLGILKTEAMAGGMAAGFGSIEAIKGGHAPAAHEDPVSGSKGSRDIPLHDQKPPSPDLESQAKQAAKVNPATELENNLKAAASPDEQPHTPGTPEAKASHDAAVAKQQLKMQGGGGDDGPPIRKDGGKAPRPDPSKGTTYVEPGSREYYAMLHEGWTDQMLREGLGPFEPPKATGGPELPAGEFKAGIKTPDDAYAAYNEAMARAPGREVGIFRNLDTGEYVVRVGGEGSVDFPHGDVPHEAVLHYHPNIENVLTYRLPSGADLSEAYLASSRTGRPVTQFVEHPIPGTTQRGRTAITVDAQTGKIRVEYVGAEGVRAKPLEFANDREYSAYYKSRTVMPQGQTLLDIIDETNRWLSKARGEPVEFGYEDGKPTLKMTGEGPAKPSTSTIDPAMDEHINNVLDEQEMKGFNDAYNTDVRKEYAGTFKQLVDEIPDPAFKEVYEIAYDALNNKKLWVDTLRDIETGARKVGPPSTFSNPAISNRYTQAIWEMAEKAALAKDPTHTAPIHVQLPESTTFLSEGAAPWKERFFDLGVDSDHGATTHMLQDLVIDRGLAAAGKQIDAQEFRGMMAKVPGPLKFALWSTIYDGLAGLNSPENLKLMLDKIFGRVD